ncbi:MAG: hypothetical protein KBS94_05445 [Prevotella sp.]|nr:hypothetical protein [Candidatus Equicola faecalis]MDO4820117.1 hypothetical protein [Prevotella sp.]
MKRKYDSPHIDEIFIQTSAIIAGSYTPEPKEDPDMELNDIVAEEQM